MSDDVAHEELKSPRAKSSKIRELLSTFEQHSVPPASPHTEIRRTRTNLQHQLDQTNNELRKQKELYKQALQEKTSLLNQLHKRESEIEDIVRVRSEEKSKYQKVYEKNKLLKSQNEELKTKIESLREKLKEKKSNEEALKKQDESKENMPQDDGAVNGTTVSVQNDMNGSEEEKKEDSISQCEEDDIAIQTSISPSELTKELESLKVRNRDSLKIIEEYDGLNRKQYNELQETKYQLLSVLTLAERLEQELSDEKDAHRITKERFENLKYTKDTSREKRSQSYTTGEVNSYINNDIQVPTLDIPTQAISPGTQSKKKKRTFMRKFGKSQSKMEYASTENVTQPSFPVLPSPHREHKREVIAGPNSKQELMSMGVSDSPVAMSEDQMQRELEVLLLLGETLQTELANEKKAHSNTKNRLQELQAKLEDYDLKGSNGISNMIRRSKSTVSNDLDIVEHPSSVITDQLKKELEEIEREQYYNIDDLSLQSSQVEIYDLSNTVAEMIAFADYLIHSASNPS